MKPFFDPTGKFQVIAHRGASREFPENTIESFARAVEIYPECMLELDLWMSRDGEIIVMHDGVLDATTSGSGNLYERTLDEIKQAEAGHRVSFDGGKSFPFRGRGIRPATFKEVLEKFPGSRISADIKYDSFEFASSVLRCIQEYKAEDRVILGSFHGRIVSRVRMEKPRIATSFTRNEVLLFTFIARTGVPLPARFPGDALMVPEFSSGEKPEDLGRGVFQGIRVIIPRFIDMAHNMGKPVYIWTVNRKENMERLITWGADGIVSDDPRLLVDTAAHLIGSSGKIH